MPLHPAQESGDIFTGSGYLAYLERNRSFGIQGYDGFMETASMLKSALLASRGSSWAVGADVRRVARRVVKPLVHAGNLHLEVAKAMSTAAAVFRANCMAPAESGAGVRKFDPAK